MSWPAMREYFPVLGKPDKRAYINRGLRERHIFGPRLRDSRTPGRKGSIRMSILRWRRRVWIREMERGDLRSKVREDLCRVRRSEVIVLFFSVVGRSMRRTEAP